MAHLTRNSLQPIERETYTDRGIINRVHCAGLSDFSARGAARRHFSRQVTQLFRRTSDGKMNVQSACALNT
jgi:hypothetical protein